MTAVKPGRIYFERIVRCRYDDNELRSNLPPAKFVTALEKAGWVNKGNVWTCPNDHEHTDKTPNMEMLFLGVIMVRAAVECALDDAHRVVSRWIVAGGPENDQPLINLLARTGWYRRSNFWLHPAHKYVKVKKPNKGK